MHHKRAEISIRRQLVHKQIIVITDKCHMELNQFQGQWIIHDFVVSPSPAMPLELFNIVLLKPSASYMAT